MFSFFSLAKEKVMRIKMKLIIGASLLTLVPVLVVSAVLAWVAARDSRQALANQAQNQLISVRDTSRQAIEDYFAFMTAQVQTFSNNKMGLYMVFYISATIPRLEIICTNLATMIFF